MLKKNYLLLTILGIIILFFIILRLKQEPSHPKAWIFETYQSEMGWGYRIFTGDSVLLIQQDMIPGLPGNAGFERQVDAERTAQLVIQKLNRGIFPPAVTLEELDSMQVLPTR